MRLARIGYDTVLGFVPDVEDYLVRHEDQVTRASRLNAGQDQAWLTDDVQVVDIRGVGELAAGMVPGAVHIPLPQLAGRVGELDADRPVVLYCAGGWRSSVGASLLRARGFSDVSDILGGYTAWAATHPLAG